MIKSFINFVNTLPVTDDSHCYTGIHLRWRTLWYKFLSTKGACSMPRVNPLIIPFRPRECSKNPCPCRNHTFLNEVHHQGMGRTLLHAKCFPGYCAFPNEVHHQGLGSTRRQAKCFISSDDAPSWEMCNFCKGMGSCLYPMTCKKHQGCHAKIAHFCTPLIRDYI